MKIAGIDWFELNADEVRLYDGVLASVPGVDRLVHRDTGAVVRLRVHRTHLPLLRGTPQPEPRSTPRPSLTPENEAWLRPYQRAAVEYIHGRASTLLAFDLGVGKTATATAAAQLPVLVLCPVSAIPVWQQEAERLGWKHFAATNMSKAQIRECYGQGIDMWIFPYSLALRFAGDWTGTSPQTPQIHTLILDEFHVCTNRRVSWAKATRQLARKQTVALTATPMRNRLPSLWGLLDALSPGAWGTHAQFRIRYCGAYMGSYGLEDSHPTNQDELQARLGEVLLKRTWADVGLDKVIPPLTRESHSCPADFEQIRAVVEAKGAEGRREQIAIMTAVRQEVGRQKLANIIRCSSVAHWQKTYRRVIYWVWHKDMAKTLAKHLTGVFPELPVDVLVGESLTSTRRKIVREWEHGDLTAPRALVASIGAGSTAINLTTARAAVFVEFAWDTLSQMQAEKRHHRFGQKHPTVTAIYCVLEGTLDERMLDVLLQKAQHSELALGEDGQTDLIREVRGERPESWLSSLM